MSRRWWFTSKTANTAPASGVVMHLKADGTLFQLIDGTTAAVADNDVVGYWTDAGSGLKPLTAAANDTTRPTLKTNNLNGKPIVRFDGSNDVLRHTAATPFGAGNGAWTMFVVMKLTSTGATQYPLGGGNAASAGTSLFFEVLDTDDHLDIGTGNSADASCAAASFTYGAWKIITIRHANLANIDAIEAWIGTTAQTITGPATAMNLPATFNFSVGSLAGAGTACATVDIAELITYDSALSVNAREQTYNYLKAKYGL